MAWRRPCCGCCVLVRSAGVVAEASFHARATSVRGRRETRALCFVPRRDTCRAKDDERRKREQEAEERKWRRELDKLKREVRALAGRGAAVGTSGSGDEESGVYAHPSRVVSSTACTGLVSLADLHSIRRIQALEKAPQVDRYQVAAPFEKWQNSHH